MRIKILFAALFLSVAVCCASAALALSGSPRVVALAAAGCSIPLMIILYRSFVKPSVAAQRGLELLSAQDLNNRLVETGEPGADRVARLFNEMMLKLRNERLRQREQDTFLRLLLEASPMGVAVMNLNNEIAMANISFVRMTGMPAETDLRGRKLEEIDSPLTHFLAGLDTDASSTMRPAGNILYRCQHLKFMQDGFRRHFYLVENLADELRKAEKSSYEKVIRMISHEVNNTMGSVNSVLETVAEESENDPDLRDTLESCILRCGSLCGFIESFADLARLPEPVRRKVDLDGEISRMLPFLRLMSGGNIRIYFEPCPEGSAPVEADIHMLQQALVNIVKNAVESISESGWIKISTGFHHEKVILEIANNGRPIDPDTAGHLFTPFFSTKDSGRGLGLTLVSEILDRHSCEFMLATDAEGITRFTIRFRATH